MVGDVEDLDEVGDALDTCFDRPEKYIHRRRPGAYRQVQKV